MRTAGESPTLRPSMRTRPHGVDQTLTQPVVGAGAADALVEGAVDALAVDDDVSDVMGATAGEAVAGATAVVEEVGRAVVARVGAAVVEEVGTAGSAIGSAE